jgi:hypothetical protein
MRSMLQEGFDCLLIADKNLKNQQNLDKYSIRLIILRIFDNRFKTLLPCVSIIQEAIMNAKDSEKIIEIDIRNL